jgi:hypothetical protein
MGTKCAEGGPADGRSHVMAINRAPTQELNQPPILDNLPGVINALPGSSFDDLVLGNHAPKQGRLAAKHLEKVSCRSAVFGSFDCSKPLVHVPSGRIQLTALKQQWLGRDYD